MRVRAMPIILLKKKSKKLIIINHLKLWITQSLKEAANTLMFDFVIENNTECNYTEWECNTIVCCWWS